MAALLLRSLVPALAALLAAGPGCRESTPPASPAEPAPTPAPDEAEEPEPEPTPAPDGAGEPSGRALLVPEDHPLYDRVEGTSLSNACESDGDCHVGGCSSEICSAEQGVNSTCEARDWPTEGGACGCVEGSCRWYDAAGAGEASAGGGEELPGQGEDCAGEGRCREGLTCVAYHGVAGRKGPTFSSCEIRCDGGGSCPDGQSCVNIADGPGRVCR